MIELSRARRTTLKCWKAKRRSLLTMRSHPLSRQNWQFSTASSVALTLNAAGRPKGFRFGFRFAVGMLIAEHPPHRSGRARFEHPACMGLSLSRGRHANLVVLCIPFFCSTRAASTLPSRPHISIAVAAQRRSRTALLQRRRRLVLDGREHGGRLPAIGWLAVR